MGRLSGILRSGKLASIAHVRTHLAYERLREEIAASRAKGGEMPISEKQRRAADKTGEIPASKSIVWFAASPGAVPGGLARLSNGGVLLEFKLPAKRVFPETGYGNAPRARAKSPVSLDNLVAVHVHEKNAEELSGILRGFEKFKKLKIVSHE
ncbi:MAG: hypothetical protein WC792_04650 [Candidatus Micrarchaeia archaeon]